MKATSRAREVRTGLFVIVGLAILLALTLWVAGSNPLGASKATYKVLMKDAGGVRPGDQVRLAGVPVGRVRSVDLQDDKEWPVVFRVELDGAISLTEESQARFSSDGILGSAFLSIDPGSADAPPLIGGSTILGTKSSDITGALGRVDEVIDKAVTLLDETTVLVRGMTEKVDPLMARVEDLLSRENVDELSTTLSLLRQTLEEVRPQVPTLLVRLEATLGGIDQGVETIPRLTAEAQALVTDLRAALGPEGERLRAVLESADGTFAQASESLGVVTGSAGDLEATLRDLRDAASNLRMLSKELRERPDRLILPPRKADRRPGDTP